MLRKFIFVELEEITLSQSMCIVHMRIKTRSKLSLILFKLDALKLGFPTGRDFLIPRDKGTEVSSLSRDKGTTGQKSLYCQRDKLKILPRNRPGRDFAILPRDGPGRDFDTGQKGKKRQFLTFFEKKFANQIVVLSRDRRVCPRIFAAALVPGQRDRGIRKLFCPGTKGQRDKETFLSRDKGTTGRPVPDCPGTSLGNPS